MKDLCTLPSIIGHRVLAELDAAGIPAGAPDLSTESSGNLSGLAGSTMTIQIDHAADLEKARMILERILKAMNLDATLGGLHGENEIMPDRTTRTEPEGFLGDGGDHSGPFDAGFDSSGDDG